MCKNLIAIESKCKLSHRRAPLIWKKPGLGRLLSLFSGAGGFDLGFKQALPCKIVARTTSSGFPSLWDAPMALCKHPNGMG